MTSRARHRSRAALAAGVLLAVVAACGGGAEDAPGQDDDGSTPGSAFTLAPRTETTIGPGGGTPGSTPGDDGDGEPETVEFTVGEEVWHSGFRIEVVDGAVTPEERGTFATEIRYVLTIRMQVENLGSEAAFFGPAATVTANTGAYVWDSGFSSAGDIPGGLTDDAEIRLVVDEGFDPATATLIFGDADENRAVVPLGVGGDAAVRLEPRTIDVSGELSLELIDLLIDGAELRYDRVERHRQVEAGKQALTLHFDVVSRNQGNWSIFATDFALVLPDGRALAPDGSDLPNIPGSGAGVTTEGLFVRFLVDEGTTGDLTLRFTPGSWFVGEDGVEEATFEFALP
jgi:hypothetical protein